MQEKVALEKSHNARNVFSTSIPRTRIKIVLLNNLSRNASCHAIIRDIFCYNRISTYYTMFPNFHVPSYYDMSTQPTSVAYFHIWFSIIGFDKP